MTREEWLKRGVRALRPLLRKAGVVMRDRWQVSMSLTSTSRSVGQCWHGSTSQSGQTTNILISPELSDPVEILDTLLHEMIHASLPPETQHGASFRQACAAIGLTKGRPTEASAGPALRKVLVRVARFLGQFPHDPMIIDGFERRKKKGGYWPVFCSPTEPRYRVQISAKALDAHGPPRCPLTEQLMIRAKGRAPRW